MLFFYTLCAIKSCWLYQKAKSRASKVSEVIDIIADDMSDFSSVGITACNHCVDDAVDCISRKELIDIPLESLRFLLGPSMLSSRLTWPSYFQLSPPFVMLPMSEKLFDRAIEPVKPLLIDLSMPNPLVPIESVVLTLDTPPLVLPILRRLFRTLFVREKFDFKDMFIKALPPKEEGGSLSPEIVLNVISSVAIL